MSEELSDFFALPPFKADEALVKLRRDLRELKALAEKGTADAPRYEWKGLPVITVALADGDPAALSVALAKKPARSPAWAKTALRSGAQQRQWLDEVKRSLQRWDDED